MERQAKRALANTVMIMVSNYVKKSDHCTVLSTGNEKVVDIRISHSILTAAARVKKRLWTLFLCRYGGQAHKRDIMYLSATLIWADCIVRRASTRRMLYFSFPPARFLL